MGANKAVCAGSSYALEIVLDEDKMMKDNELFSDFELSIKSFVNKYNLNCVKNESNDTILYTRKRNRLCYDNGCHVYSCKDKMALSLPFCF